MTIVVLFGAILHVGLLWLFHVAALVDALSIAREELAKRRGRAAPNPA